jgi:hypothetical protein
VQLVTKARRLHAGVFGSMEGLGRTFWRTRMAVVVSGVTAMLVAQTAARQRTADCVAWLPGYQHDVASVDQMRYYASCVEWLHPVPLNDAQHLWVKTAILAGFVGIGIGIWWSRNDSVFNTWYGRALFGGFYGSLSGMCAVGAAAAVYYGARYLVA